MITTEDFPQADKIEHVFEAVEAVGKGYRTDIEIEKYIELDSDGRQGRYYRKPAIITGLVKNVRNHATLTDLGKEFVSLKSDSAKMDFFAQCLTSTPLFEMALKYINSNDPNPEQLRLWFTQMYPGKKGTADRRYPAFIIYLTQTGLIEFVSDKYKVKPLGSAGLIIKHPQDKTLAGKKVGSKAPKSPSSGVDDFIKYNVSRQKRERANHTHWKLVNLKSNRLIAAGFNPRENIVVDLFAEEKNDAVLYEMKSISDNEDNFVSQTRKAISQLYEYRFIYSEPTAKLCIVTNKPVPKKYDWILDYLTNDRLIGFSWTEDFKNFNFDKKSQKLLGRFSEAK